MTEIAACRFCGQVQGIDIPEDYESDANEYASLRCKCPEAETYQFRTRELNKAMIKLDELFGSLCGKIGVEPVPEDQYEILKELIELLVNDVYTSVTMDLGEGVKAKINRNSTGNVELTRTDTQKTKR